MRNIESSAITAVIPVLALVPAWVVSVSLIWWAVSLIFPIPILVFIVIAALGATGMFIAPTQRLVVLRLLGTRTPTQEELDRLLPIVALVTQSARVGSRKFILAVDDSDDINAFACGGHILVVSSYALRELSDSELSGVVAHELSHHLGSHTFALAIGQWLSLPIIACARVGFFLQRVAAQAEQRINTQSTALRIAGRVLTTLLMAIAWIFQAALIAAQMLNNWVGKDAEFQADARAVTLGFGRQLASALTHVRARNSQQPRRAWHDRIFVSHPPARTRIARIEAQLRARDRRR